VTGRTLYLWREADASLRYPARFCSLGPPPAASPVTFPVITTPASRASAFPPSVSSVDGATDIQGTHEL
jgi:hypothetical protein